MKPRFLALEEAGRHGLSGCAGAVINSHTCISDSFGSERGGEGPELGQSDTRLGQTSVRKPETWTLGKQGLFSLLFDSISNVPVKVFFSLK